MNQTSDYGSITQRRTKKTHLYHKDAKLFKKVLKLQLKKMATPRK
jgi:hypothetical protein